MAHQLRALAVVSAAFLLASCSATPPVATPSASPSSQPSQATAAAAGLVGPVWLLAELGGKAPASGTSVTATFGADGTVSGSGGCNRYTGRYTASGTTLRVEESIASTMMACDAAVMTQEAAFLGALKSARGFTVAAERLTLTAEGGAALASFGAQKQALAGTTWKVTGFNNGQAAVVGVLTGTNPTLTFGADGTVSGSAGCNTLRGAFTTEGSTIKLGPLATTKMACAEPAGVMEQEGRLVAALESSATFGVQGDGLELRTASDALAATLTRG